MKFFRAAVWSYVSLLGRTGRFSLPYRSKEYASQNPLPLDNFISRSTNKYSWHKGNTNMSRTKEKRLAGPGKLRIGLVKSFRAKRMWEVACDLCLAQCMPAYLRLPLMI